MLYEFLLKERDTILNAAKQRATQTHGARVISDTMEGGWSNFYNELIHLLKTDEPFEARSEHGVHTVSAEKQGAEYLKEGYTVSEVVHSYGIICQTITGTASKLAYSITAREFQRLNLSLDTAIAEAVSEFEKLRSNNFNVAEVERLGFLAHELRNNLQSATIALEVLEEGNVGVRGSTGRILGESLKKMAALIDTSLTEVRLRSETKTHMQRLHLIEMMSEVGTTAGIEARAKDQVLDVQAPSNLEVEVDRQLFVSALANLVQNALKFTPRGGMIQVRARQENDRVLVEVEDQCGGLPDDKIEELFKPGVQHSSNRSGIGFGLAISKEAIEKNNGVIRVQNLPGKGCIFIVDLPKPADNNEA